LGVAIPFGTISALVIYLIYYAVATRGQDQRGGEDPFGIDRLLMIGLVAAILAHYVEIHFGIAIASTRTHFFVYLGLLFAVGHYLPQIALIRAERQAETPKGPRKRRGRVSSTKDDNWLSPVLSSAMILGLIIGILGFNYIAFSLPPGQTIQSIEDVPSAGTIINQSFFINPGEGFIESPFIFLLIILSWSLGVLLFLSEIAREGKIKLAGPSTKLPERRFRQAGIIFTAMLAVAMASRFFVSSDAGIGLNQLFGFSLLLIWAAFCLFAAFRLFQKHHSGRLVGGVVALIGLIFTLPVLVSGSYAHGLVMLIGSGIALYLLWDRAWNDLLLPAAILALTSLLVGLGYFFIHASLIRAGILPPPGVTEATTAIERRILEANQSTTLLTGFYLFLFVIMIAMAYFLVRPKLERARSSGTIAGFVSVVPILALSIFLIGESNLQVIQADIIFKRADPWDKEAGRTGDPATWDNAIAIYEHAIKNAPSEDFYYLWLGRAYLERSGVTEDETEQFDLLRTAESRLEQAQGLNPYNTDHTANLARLNTRWAELSSEGEKGARVQEAADYYESAMVLSPQNAVIINEYARLVYLLQNDCERALDIYDHSSATDPFYAATYFDGADIAKLCGDQATDEVRLMYFEISADKLSEGLKRKPENARRWLQLAEIQIALGNVQEAEQAYEEALLNNEGDLQRWQIDLTMAQWWLNANEFSLAEEYGKRALDSVPPDSLDSVQQLLDLVDARRAESEN
jgi:tetratricopeptide (TPR) repeat protein